MFGLPHFFGLKNKIWDKTYSILLVGAKRQGKSTLLAMIAQECVKRNIKVYSNYPIANTIKIPKIKDTRTGKLMLDKNFLYDNPLLNDSVILLDEVSNIWNNRAWGKWTEDDTDFFNYLGKHNTRVFMAIQYYDMIDLNVKRNLDATWFVEKSLFPNTSIVECDIQDIRKVEDLQTHVVDSKYHKITYEPVVMDDGRYYFRRKKWYPYFLTLYSDEAQKKNYNLEFWNDLAFGSAGAEARQPNLQEENQ